ncbi:hypothetical protein B0J12DRAFT_734538 [Macrophomina phaseolina]|uniref:Uncharacterized protein n=1 Tax=Macrophomina phaseolina TaxID=35725 RepID=A0ABQ8GVT3_9PEZI|nr:hypothetical protein B0J12DRAFT_734538 [Macrophomina phaseolina]
MSTFDGLVAGEGQVFPSTRAATARLRRLRRLTLRQEFPAIQVDFFRASSHHPPPLACLLSRHFLFLPPHVHSDRLQGLDSLKAPFVYCSPATREILLRLGKYPRRLNFAKGILESRIPAYTHLKKLLKTIPLETPHGHRTATWK